MNYLSKIPLISLLNLIPLGKLKRVLFIALLVVFGCEDKDTTPPTVSISSPVSGQTVYGLVRIIVATNDNEGISRVEFFVNDSLVVRKFKCGKSVNAVVNVWMGFRVSGTHHT